MPKIEFRAGGDVSRAVAEREATRLSAESSIETEIIQVRQLFGLDALAVAVIGGAAGNLVSHLVIRLAESVVKQGIPITISLRHRGSVRNFKLPEEQADCVEAVSEVPEREATEKSD